MHAVNNGKISSTDAVPDTTVGQTINILFVCTNLLHV